MIILKAVETDTEIKGKAFVHWKSWHEAYTGIIDEAYLDGFTLQKCEKIAFQYPDNLICAEDGEQIIGWLGYGGYRDNDLQGTGEIYGLYILREYYGQGVGYRLLKAGVKSLLKYQHIALWVLDNNPRAINFYRRAGFRFDGEQKVLNVGSPIIEKRMILKVSDFEKFRNFNI